MGATPGSRTFGERGGDKARLVNKLEPAASWLRAITPRSGKEGNSERSHRERHSEHFMLTTPQPRHPMISPKPHMRDIAQGATFFSGAKAPPMAGGFKPAGRQGTGYTLPLRDQVTV